MIIASDASPQLDFVILNKFEILNVIYIDIIPIVL